LFFFISYKKLLPANENPPENWRITGYKEGISQSMGSSFIFCNISLVLEKGLLPKKPFRAEKGLGCADSIT
jgi:hypothetical protein